MAQVAVTIAGKTYRVACDEGEEARLCDLAGLVEARIADIRERFGEIGDRRLTIMAAITLADELEDKNRRIRELEAELADLETRASQAMGGCPDWREPVATGIGDAADRIERVARALNGNDPT